MPAFHSASTLYVGGAGEFSFPSIEEALKYVRELRRVGISQPITIRLNAPEYTLTAPILIDPEVTGITIEPAGSGRTRLLGGYAITGFVWDEYNGAKCVSAPIPPQGLDENGQCNFSDLYVNGARAKLTRYPRQGYLYAEAVENNEPELWASSKWFIAKEGDIGDFKNITRGIVSYCHYWLDEHSPIEAYDPATRKLTMKYLSSISISENQGDGYNYGRLEYYIENLGETFENPGEWYADGGRVYYIPEGDVAPESITAYAPVLSKAVRICGTTEKKARNIRLRNLDFAVFRGEYAAERNGREYASDMQAVSGAGGVLSFENAAHCSVESCSVQNFGLYGVVLDKGCEGIRLDGCDIVDGGAGGVKMLGGHGEDKTSGNTITNCRILHCGKRYFGACGILMMDTSGNTVTHNEIAHMYYTGISCGWVWGYMPNLTFENLLAKNHIHHIGDGVLSDMGGIYCLGIQPGTVLSGNLIHDVKSRVYGGSGIYLDEGSTGITVENNVIYNTESCVTQHYGAMNVLRNNVLVSTGTPAVHLGRGEAHLSLILEGNIFASAGEGFFALNEDDRILGWKTIQSTRNLFWSAASADPLLLRNEKRVHTLADFVRMGIDTDSVIADPLFADAESRNYALAPGSPAYALGFGDICTGDVGPQRPGK